MNRLLLSASTALLLAACGANTEDAPANAPGSATEPQAQASSAEAPSVDGPSLEEILAEEDLEARMALLEARGQALQDNARSLFERHIRPIQDDIGAVADAMEATQAELDAIAAANVAPIIAEARACEGGSEDAPDFTPPEADESMSVSEANIMVTQALMLAAEASDCVFALPSGLRFRIDRAAGEDAPVANPGEMVEVHYEGTLPDGTVFDSSYVREETTRFPSNGVIAGWVEALAHMRVGEQWTLFIPADLGYGAAGRGPIGPNEAMRFKVELVSLPNRMINVPSDGEQ